jgi:hypothetical protein
MEMLMQYRVSKYNRNGFQTYAKIPEKMAFLYQGKEPGFMESSGNKICYGLKA